MHWWYFVPAAVAVFVLAALRVREVNRFLNGEED